MERKRGVAQKILAAGTLVAASAYLGLCAFLYANQDALVFPGASLGLPVTGWPGVQPVSLSLADGTKLRGGRAAPPAGAETGAGTVLYFGGNAEDATALLPEIARATGRVAIAYNYRGFAGSEGVPSIENFEADAVAIYRQTVKEATQNENAPVAILGRSIGTGAALAAAASAPAAAGATGRLALVSPYDSVSAVAADAFPFFPVRMLLSDDVDARASARKVGWQVLVLLAGEDVEIPNERSLALAQAFPSKPTLIKIPGVGHNEILAREETWGGLSGFFYPREAGAVN